jgi:G3E family GTPase
VIVNEFGEIGLDHLMVERSSEYRRQAVEAARQLLPI